MAPALAAADQAVITLVATVLGGSGLLALVALIRAPKQNRFDIVQAQHLIYTELRGELDGCKDELDECRADRQRLRDELRGERGEIKFLRDRIGKVEKAMRRDRRDLMGDAGVFDHPDDPESSD